MKKLIASLASAVVITAAAMPANAQAGNNFYTLVPKPVKLTEIDGNFTLSAKTHIFPETEAALPTAKFLADRIKVSAGYDMIVEPVGTKTPKENAIILTTRGAARGLGPEGYSLTVTPALATISAATPAGLFYGTQSFFQLSPPAILGNAGKTRGTWLLSCAKIEDSPRFAWRGLLLDVSRHYFTPAEIKRLMDEMAVHKLNTLQLHLTDNEGWRLAIDKYPLLTEVGAWRDGVGFGLDPKSTTAYSKDGKYGGFYTKEQIKDLIAYGEERHISIVPEIELPGHAAAAVRAYPELACDKDSDVVCAGNENTYAFLQNVLAEVFELFPSKYVHIGGDEVSTDHWQKCEKCQAKMKELGLKTPAELETYMIQRISSDFKAKNKTLIGWSEIKQGGRIPQGAVLMDWIGGAVEAASSGHNVVMAPKGAYYLDYYQSPDYKTEPAAMPNSYLSLQTAYNFEPVPTDLPEAYVRNIIGTEGCIWTEYIPSMEQIEYQAFPRACAIAEVAWSPKESRDWTDFQHRMGIHAKRLLSMDVNFRGASVMKMARAQHQHNNN